MHNASHRTTARLRPGCGPPNGCSSDLNGTLVPNNSTIIVQQPHAAAATRSIRQSPLLAADQTARSGPGIVWLLKLSQTADGGQTGEPSIYGRTM